jgi:transglutaminase-like putative cysteine protease
MGGVVMIYEVRQTTRYTYDLPVTSARQVIRLTPAHGGGQERKSYHLALSLQPDEQTTDVDFFGNRTTYLTFSEPFTKLDITTTSIVSVDRPPPPMAALTPAWTEIAEAALAARDLSPRSPVHMLYASRKVPLLPALTAYGARSFPAPYTPVLSGALDLMARIKADFAYDPEATDVTTPVAEAFEKRRGVCQDFAHIMISALRGLGLPAAYVSGYLRTLPPPGKPRLEGADATHAWVEVWCGEATGWVALDPTNAMVAGQDHIVIAIGRDYADVAPVDGVIVTAGGHGLDVMVDVIPLTEVGKRVKLGKR